MLNISHLLASGSRATSSVTAVAALSLVSVLLWDFRVFTLALVLALRWFTKPLVEAFLEASTPVPQLERTFESGSDLKHQFRFPNLLDNEQQLVDLSVVVPAYREELRLQKMLDEAVDYLEVRRRQQPAFTWEIIIVDDGSPDGTFKLALQYTDKYSSEKIRVLKLAKNGGKGGAVRKGMFRSRGKLILMCDADGATKFSEVERLESALKKVADGGVAFGSRTHLFQQQQQQRNSGLRGFFSQVFQTLFVSMLVPGGIRDTQCGFKLFTRRAAQLVFPVQRMNGWAFDCELLFLARLKFNLPALEVAVDWTDVDGSTLSVADASLEMARDILLMSAMYGLGLW